MTNHEKAEFIAKQCKPCSKDFYDGIYQGVLIALNSQDLESCRIVKDLQDKLTEKTEELEKWTERANYCVNSDVPNLLSEIKKLKDRHKSDVINAIVANLYELGDDEFNEKFAYEKADKYYKRKFEL